MTDLELAELAFKVHAHATFTPEIANHPDLQWEKMPVEHQQTWLEAVRRVLKTDPPTIACSQCNGTGDAGEIMWGTTTPAYTVPCSACDGEGKVAL